MLRSGVWCLGKEVLQAVLRYQISKRSASRVGLVAHAGPARPGPHQYKRMGEESCLVEWFPSLPFRSRSVRSPAKPLRRPCSPEQQEVWKVEQQQWKMDAAKDVSWIETLAHPNLRYWETGAPMPRDRASQAMESLLLGELDHPRTGDLPISATITGNVAVVQYNYMIARENYKKDRETVTGHYTDVLIKEGGRWLFIAWAGGDYPKK